MFRGLAVVAREKWKAGWFLVCVFLVCFCIIIIRQEFNE